MKKKISVTLEQNLDKELTRRAKEMGLSKSAFIAFASSYMLHQINYTERTTGKQGVYQLLRNFTQPIN